MAGADGEPSFENRELAEIAVNGLAIPEQRCAALDELIRRHSAGLEGVLEALDAP